jgi:adenylate kinase
VVGIITEVMKSERCENGFILDGFPRTVPQADALEIVLKELRKPVEIVISLEASDEELVNRLSKRVSCAKCKSIFNLLVDKLADQKTCPNCGGSLYQREDDKPETIRKRLKVYAESTAPVKEFYRQRGLLHTVPGLGAVERITDNIVAEINRK